MTAAHRHASLSRLDQLVGAWRLEAEVNGQVVGGGRTTFEWIEDGTFLLQRTERDVSRNDAPREWIENSPEPVVCIIGLDDTLDQFTMLYGDARNVFRVYTMTLSDEAWNIWRNAPGFSQRFTGTFSDDFQTINGAWEGSTDGTTWNHDFRLTYVKLD